WTPTSATSRGPRSRPVASSTSPRARWWSCARPSRAATEAPPMTSADALRERAGQLGVETSYWDVAGHHHEASEATLRAIVDVLEVDVTAIAGDVPPVVVGQPSRVFVGGACDA